jgi:catecholate siderophore receptor
VVVLHKNPQVGEQGFPECQGQQNCSLLELIVGRKGACPPARSFALHRQTQDRGQNHMDRQSRSTVTGVLGYIGPNARVPTSLRLAQSGGLAAVLAAIPIVSGAVSAAALDGSTPETITVTETQRRHNPNADPAAPYKIDQSASPKIQMDLLDMPKSISVISKEAISDSGAVSFKDLMRTQPGVTLGVGEGGNAYGDRIFIRGFDARNDVYIDGLRDPGVGSREIFAVEQIEILKGPSSTFGGRGTTGGAVSIITKAPQRNFFAHGEATLGTDGTRRAAVDVNTPVTEKVQLRVNGVYHEADVAERDHVSGDRWGIAGGINAQASDQLRFYGDYYHLTTHEVPDWGIPYDTKSNRPFAVPRSSFYGVLARDFRNTFADIYTLRGTYDLGGKSKIQSVTRYGNTGNAYIASAPESPDATNANPNLWTVRANPKQRDAVTTYWANQTDITTDFSIAGTRHQLVSGFEISRERIRNRNYQNLSSELQGTIIQPSTILQPLFAPNANAPWPFPKSLQSVRESTADSQGVYVMDNITLAPKWMGFAGVRYDRYQLDVDTLTLATGVHAPVQNHVSFWNGQVGLTYKPEKDGTLYVSYGSSSNPSGEELDASAADYGGLATTNAALQPERNTSYEAGVKWNLGGGHLNVTAAIFRTDKENARVTIGAGSASSIVLAGVQRVDGVELGLAGNVTSQWRATGGITLVDARTVESPNAAQIGAKFPNVAKTSFSLMNRYFLTDQISFGETSSYNSRRYGGTATANITYVPSYWRHDLFAKYDIQDGLELSVNVLNVTNKLYYDALYRSTTPFVYVAPGRSVLVKLEYEF